MDSQNWTNPCKRIVKSNISLASIIMAILGFLSIPSFFFKSGGENSETKHQNLEF